MRVWQLEIASRTGYRQVLEYLSPRRASGTDLHRLNRRQVIGVASISEFLEDIGKAADLQAIYDSLGAELAGMGFDRFAYHILRPPEGEGPSGAFSEVTAAWRPQVRAMSTYPESWLQHYRDEDFFNADPILRTAVQSLLPFKWDELRGARPATDKESRVLDEARDFGVSSGITVPIHGPAGGVATLNVSGGMKDAELAGLWETQRHRLHLIAHHAHEAIVRCVYTSAGVNTTHLTERERECLLWTARGKTTWEVSEILTISQNTVRFHLRNAMARLEVFSKHHAVVKAVLLGLIVP